MTAKLRNHKLVSILILLLFSTAFVVLAPLGCRTNKNHVTMGIQTSPAMALVMVAKDKQFFDAEGLDVELKEFTAGKFALQAFLGGSLDFAVAGEVPVTLSTLQGSNFYVLSQVVEKTSNEVRVVARREESITDATTYFKKKKRKLATSFGGGPEFFTYNFLKKHGIAANEVEIISQKPEDMPAALVNGSVDAVSIFDPFAFISEKQMGDKGITFADSDIYSELYVLTVSQDTVEKRRDVVDKLLKALIKAQEFVKGNPDEAKNIVIKYTKLDRSVIEGIWKNFSFGVALNKLLLDYQNQEAVWAREKGTVPANAPAVDFRQRIYDAPLKGIKPEAVQLP
jgi:ABC-type nitrate/sulfonate/bicarbonate transport system substrate-binding protein